MWTQSPTAKPDKKNALFLKISLPCTKGDHVRIKISQEEYSRGVENCKQIIIVE